MADIDNNDDIIDSRDVIEKVEELEESISDNESDLEEEIAELDRLEEELEKLNDQLSDDDGSDDDALFEVQTEANEHENEIARLCGNIDGLRSDIKDLEEELEPFKDLANEGEGYGDWSYGETLIRESYFVDYCKELLSDIGDLPNDLPSYIENNIDCDGVADDLKVDYTTLDFDGVEYLMRA